MKFASSSQIGKFAEIAGQTAHVHDVADGRSFSIDVKHLKYIFAGANDVEIATAKSVSAHKDLLGAEYRRYVTLRLFIAFLDERESADERAEVAVLLGKRLSDISTVNFLENNLYASPLPPDTKSEPLLTAAEGILPLHDLAVKLLENQPAIAKVRKAFNRLPYDLFETIDRVSFVEKAISAGAFKMIVTAVQGGDVNFALLNLLRTMRGVDGASTVLQRWLDPFRTQPQRRRRQNDEPEAEYFDDKAPHLGDRAAFERAMVQQAAIVQKLRTGQIDVARRFADDLVTRQRLEGSPAHVAMSLCKLSMEAKALQILPLQLEWAEKAVTECADDPKTHGHLADALIALSRYLEASLALKNVEKAGNAAFAATGHARILRAQGRLTQSRTAFLRVLETDLDAEDRVHALAGAAGVLRELGRFDESLAEFDRALSEFPANPTLEQGRAATLTEMGELELARDSFVQLKDAGEAAIFARNGRANLYRLAGNLDRALREYKDVAAQYGYDYWSRCGIAQVLRLQGHASKAVSAYREVVEKFPYVPQGYIGLADVLAEQRRMLEAISTLVAAAKKFPEVPRIAIRLNAFRSRIGSSSTALADLDRLLAEYPDDIEAKAQRADTYRIMWRFEEALQDYEDILQSHPWNRSAKNGAASVHLAMGNFAKAEFLLETGVARSQEEWRAQLLLAHVLIQKNSYREARHLLKGALRRIPFAREKELMAATLASLELESGAPSNAVHLMEKSTMSASKVVRLHALAQARRKSAKSDLELVMSTTDKPFRPLINAIALRYGIAKGRSTQDHRWILTQERSAILSAA